MTQYVVLYYIGDPEFTTPKVITAASLLEAQDKTILDLHQRAGKGLWHYEIYETGASVFGQTDTSKSIK